MGPLITHNDICNSRCAWLPEEAKPAPRATVDWKLWNLRWHYTAFRAVHQRQYSTGRQSNCLFNIHRFGELHILRCAMRCGALALVLPLLVLNLASTEKLLDQQPITYRWVYRNPFRNISLPDPPDALALQYSHMGMLAVLPNGSLASSWQAAPVYWEGSDKQGIYWALSNDYGLTWDRCSLLVSPDGLPAWGPVLHVEAGMVYLFHAVSKQKCWWIGEGGMHWACGGDILMQSSSNSGHTWSATKVVYAFEDEGGIAKMIANKLRVTADGHWLLPFWREMGGQAECNTQPELHGAPGLLVSPDQGESWSVVNIGINPSVQATWLIEGAVASGIEENTWLQVFRTAAGSIYGSTSPDNGLHWSLARPLPLLNPNSKVDLAALPSGVLLLAYNDLHTDRSRLSLATSVDGGKSWRRVVVLEADAQGSFHYPTIQYLPQLDRVLVIYSVDYLPSGSSVAELNKSHGRRGSCPWDKKHMEALASSSLVSQQRPVEGPGEMLRTGSRSMHCSSQCRPVGAWGRVSYGMRVAILTASEIVHTSKPEQPLTAES